MNIKRKKSSCECCVHYMFDDYYEYYICEVNLDEDEMSRFMRNAVDSCPYFRSDNEYQIVKKQI